MDMVTELDFLLLWDVKFENKVTAIASHTLASTKLFSFFETVFGWTSTKCFHDEFDCPQVNRTRLSWINLIDAQPNLVSQNEKNCWAARATDNSCNAMLSSVIKDH